MFSNNTKILPFISNTHSYIPIKLCRRAKSIHLFRIRGRLNSDNVKLKKNWIWDVLEIDWSNVSITLNDNEIDYTQFSDNTIQRKIQSKKTS